MTLSPGPISSGKKNSLHVAILLGICLILISPYFILSFFDYPSADDFYYFHFVKQNGYWGAQLNIYEQWTGRYFASFILCANPLYFNSLLLYKLIPFIVLSLTVHSFYYFTRHCFITANKYHAWIAALIISFVHLNSMPSLVEGIFWESGSITYQLANILLLYFIVNCFRLSFVTDKNNRSLKIITGILIIAVCGLNETSMLTLNLVILVMLFFFLVTKKKIDVFIGGYFLLSLLCSLLLIFSPGNSIRAKSIFFPNAKNFFFTLSSGFSTATDHISEWIISPIFLLSSVLAVLLYFISGITVSLSNKRFAFLFSLISICGFLIISATFFPGFWVTGAIAPDRTINVSFFVFIITWFSLLFIFTAFLDVNVSSLKNIYWDYYPFLILLLCLPAIKSGMTGNYLNACKDLISGKATAYNDVWKKRIELMTGNSSAVCILPSFSRLPNSIFTRDITDDENYYDNLLYADFFNVNRVKVQYGEPQYVCSYFLNFDNKRFSVNNLTSKQFYSPPNSSLLDGPDSYSAGFDKPIKDLDIQSLAEIANVTVNARIFSSDSIINVTMVLAITDTLNKRQILWCGQDLSTSHYSCNKWNMERFFFPIINKSGISTSDKITIYLWNKGKSTVFMDDLSISFY